MSNAIQLQTDIGGLGIQGLGAFSNLLSTLSADNVTPMAMIQMQNLGALFHVNGQFVEQVPDKLKRFSSQPLGRLAVSIGWRRGDSASLMADSSGGQAVALLSLCLANLFRVGDVAIILHGICGRVLPKSVNVASMAQLGDVAHILCGKLQALGFGNYLAQQVMKVHSVYEQLGVGPPNDLLSPLTTEAMVDLLESLKRTFSETNVLLRVTGLAGMGYVLALILFMFPNDALITAESFILHEGSSTKKRIIIELSQAANGRLHSRVETELKTEPVIGLPIAAVNIAILNTCSFTWHGWMARYLQLTFSKFGAMCSEDLLVASCDLLIAVAPEIGNKPSHKSIIGLPRGGLDATLGEYPTHRMQRICEEIFLVRPSAARMTVLSSFAAVASIFAESVKDIKCSCQIMCDFKSGWMNNNNNNSIRCSRRQLWLCFGNSLDKALFSFAVNSGPNTSISPLYINMNAEVISLIDRTLGHEGFYFDSSSFSFHMLGLFNDCDEGDLARSSGSSTILATVLKTFRTSPSLLRTFELVDGQLVYDGRCYTSLAEDRCGEIRGRAARSIVSRPKLVEPSNIGQHSHLSLTIFEDLSGLNVKATARYAGMNVKFSLSSIIRSYFALEATDKCSHPSSSPLQRNLKGRVMITSVASPRPEGNRVGIVMTQSNPTAQFLSCHRDVRSLLLRDCCLNCAYKQARKEGFHTIIVT